MTDFSPDGPKATYPQAVADEADYLKLPITWRATRRFDHGQPYEYRLSIDVHTAAVLTMAAGKGWRLTIVHDGTPAIDKGLFGTLYDALMVVYAEFYPDRLPGSL